MASRHPNLVLVKLGRCLWVLATLAPFVLPSLLFRHYLGIRAVPKAQLLQPGLSPSAPFPGASLLCGHRTKRFLMPTLGVLLLPQQSDHIPAVPCSRLPPSQIPAGPGGLWEEGSSRGNSLRSAQPLLRSCGSLRSLSRRSPRGDCPPTDRPGLCRAFTASQSVRGWKGPAEMLKSSFCQGRVPQGSWHRSASRQGSKGSRAGSVTPLGSLL